MAPTTPSPTLQRALKGELCTGCGLCAGVSQGTVTMESISPGYSRPHQIADLPAHAEQAIRTACPATVVAPWTAVATPHQHMSWGPWIRCLTGYATQSDIRHGASSGGAISALAIQALISGEVERVLHISADPDRPTRNVIHWSDTPQDIMQGAGSRYAASSPLAEIDAALSEGKKFLFIGKPCDISALRQLATVDPRVNALVPYMLSFFCGGLPSHEGADRIIRAMGLEPEDVTSFRYRGNGWPGLTRAETADGRSGEMRYADSWGKHLSKQVQFRCKICPDAVGGVADIACADAWYGGESGYPTFEEQEGRSLILSRTKAGERLLNAATRAGNLAIEDLPIGDIDLMQPAQARRKRLVSSRLAACTIMLQPRPRMHNLDVAKASRTASLKEKTKNLLGTIRRISTNTR